MVLVVDTSGSMRKRLDGERRPLLFGIIQGG